MIWLRNHVSEVLRDIHFGRPEIGGKLPPQNIARGDFAPLFAHRRACEGRCTRKMLENHVTTCDSRHARSHARGRTHEHSNVRRADQGSAPGRRRSLG